MKKFVSLLSLSFLVGLAACGTTEDNTTEEDHTSGSEDTEETETSWDEIQESGKLVVGTSGTYSPITFHENNELTGFDVEMAREIGDRLDLEVEFSTMDFDGILPALRNGQIDVAANDFAITEERQETFELTEPYKFSYGSAVVRAEDRDRFDSAHDLEGVSVALGSLTSNYAMFAENIGADGTAYDGGTEAILRDVINGNRDAYLNDWLVLERTLEEFGDDRLVVAEPVKYHSTETVMMMKKDNVALKEVLDEVILEMLEDGTVAELAEEFLSEDISQPVDEDEVVGLEGN
ncbi:transporter substrate-binding domain-containing protein [Alteribacter populi]|uniref:transporter substrate-binding domain-containing protein n=1 Tax=Alteribacter populi TaxID=2011011 RepID=UPI000BBA514D|nr:transporter substrate-binding domain-containing protein [Alteribacter populi]